MQIMNAPRSDFWTTLPLGRGVNLIANDNQGVVALSKPPGLLSHPNVAADQPRSLLNARYVVDGEYFEWKDTAGGTRKMWLLNRLDSATSGLILAAADGALAAAIRAQFKRKQVRKVYEALVFGSPPRREEIWRDRLAVAKQGGRIRTETAGNIPSECRMSVVQVGRRELRVSLLRLEPVTGRSHQLRVQCAKRNLPIVGDQTYGNFPRNRYFAKQAGTKRLFLHSLEVSFEYEFAGRKHTFIAKATRPPEFEAWL